MRAQLLLVVVLLCLARRSVEHFLALLLDLIPVDGLRRAADPVR
jgi:hypothetical protein